VDRQGLQELLAISGEVAERFTREYNDVVLSLDSTAEPVPDAFSAISPHQTLINFPSQLADAYPLPASARFIGSSIRDQVLPLEFERSSTKTQRQPRIYASLGSFFSGRTDILGKLVAAFRNQPVELVLASGITPRSRLHGIPDHWTVSPYLPQPALIRTSDLVVTHGGNNTVTEAMTSGVPMLVGPLSTDQFSAAADIESAGLGAAFDPNFDDAGTIADLAKDLLDGEAPARAAELGAALRGHPGQELAASLVEESVNDLALT
jgi:UDP:flavonoid glycosyltransferase YjiC (YdhE family)